jgi:nicotinate-nucleotide adenylyltransferase
MVRAAIADEPRFRVDERELKKSGPSYTVDTLRSLRDEFPARPLCLVVGMDAFLGLPQWHQWREILSLAHLVVAHRPGWRAPTLGPLGELLVAHGTGVVRDLHAAPAGCIFIHAVTQLEISSTELRSLIHAGRDERYLVPEGVRRIIHETGCYARKERREG